MSEVPLQTGRCRRWRTCSSSSSRSGPTSSRSVLLPPLSSEHGTYTLPRDVEALPTLLDRRVAADARPLALAGA